jgi:hypothetical protein
MGLCSHQETVGDCVGINGYANQSLTAKISELWKHPALQSIASIKYLLKEGEDSVQGKTQQQKQLPLMSPQRGPWRVQVVCLPL